MQTFWVWNKYRAINLISLTFLRPEVKITLTVVMSDFRHSANILMKCIINQDTDGKQKFCKMVNEIFAMFNKLLFSSKIKENILFVWSLVLVWFWRYLTRGLIWHLSQSSTRPSIYFSLIVKLCSNPFLEPTSFLLKETMGAFDGAQTHDLHIMSQTCNPLRHTASWKWLTNFNNQVGTFPSTFRSVYNQADILLNPSVWYYIST